MAARVALVSGGEDSDQIKLVKKDFGFRLQNARNHFTISKGNGTYSDVAYPTGTFFTDWSWSVLLQDFDHDMYADIFITNGIVKRPNDHDYINFLNELQQGSQFGHRQDQEADRQNALAAFVKRIVQAYRTTFVFETGKIICGQTFVFHRCGILGF